MNRRVWTIAVHEYVTNVRRKEFLLITLGLPVMMLFFGGLSVIGTLAAVGPMMSHAEKEVGIIDRSGALDLSSDIVRTMPEARLTVYADEDTGRSDVKRGRIEGLIVLPPDYLELGKVTVYRKGGGILSQSERIPVGAI